EPTAPAPTIATCSECMIPPPNMLHARSSGRVRQVGRPAPGRQPSVPSNSETLHPASSRRDRVTGLPLTIATLRGDTASTLHPSVLYSSSGPHTILTPRLVSSPKRDTGTIRR